MTSVLEANIKNKERVFLTSDILSDRPLGRKHKNGTVLLCVPDLRRRTCGRQAEHTAEGPLNNTSNQSSH